MIWLLALLAWTACAAVVAPLVGRVLAYEGHRAAAERARRLPAARAAFPAQLIR